MTCNLRDKKKWNFKIFNSYNSYLHCLYIGLCLKCSVINYYWYHLKNNNSQNSDISFFYVKKHRNLNNFHKYQMKKIKNRHPDSSYYELFLKKRHYLISTMYNEIYFIMTIDSLWFTINNSIYVYIIYIFAFLM